MDYDSEPALSLSSSYESSDSSDVCYVSDTESLTSRSTSDVVGLRRPFETLETTLEYSDFNFRCDAKIVVDGYRPIPVPSRILSEKSPFFMNLFNGNGGGGGGGKEREWKFKMKELGKDFDVGFDALLAVLNYLYTDKVSSFPVSVCTCVDNECLHIGCRPVVDFMVEVIYASFTFQIPELVSLYESNLLDILDKVAIDDILVILFVAILCYKSCCRMLTKCIERVIKSDIDVVTLEKALPYDIIKQIMDARLKLGLGEPGINNFPDKNVKIIHSALDSNDVESVKMLLKKGHTNLNDSYALHYAIAYSDAKTTLELLDLGVADVNHRNPRGYTMLHVAAMRKEPEIITSLLSMGARPSDLTSDGRKALQILKRCTKFVEYNRSSEGGKSSHKDQLCIEILERAEIRDPVLGEAYVSLGLTCHDSLMDLFLNTRDTDLEREREMGHHSRHNKQKVRRGLWSPEEDEKLINYISTYGHGCWSSVPRKAGLERCARSCRLRWINYLRPDLKRGSFSSQEANLIIELHKVLGNRWSQIAKRLPGRTEYAVKNFWNSNIKKKLMSNAISDLTKHPDTSKPVT